VRQDASATPTAGVWEAEEILRQVAATRAQAGAEGNIHFSMKALAEDFDGVATMLASGPYAEPALVPAVRPPQGPLPGPPQVTSDDRGVAFAPAGNESTWLWLVRSRRGDDWQTAVLPGRMRRADIAPAADEIVVSEVARDGREGTVTRITPTRP